MKVYKECCQNCLLSSNRIVSPQRAKQIIQDTTASQSYFICHKASMKDDDVVCRNYYDKLGHTSQMVRIAGRLGCIEFVEQEDKKKLPSYQEMK